MKVYRVLWRNNWCKKSAEKLNNDLICAINEDHAIKAIYKQCVSAGILSIELVSLTS